MLERLVGSMVGTAKPGTEQLGQANSLLMLILRLKAEEGFKDITEEQLKEILAGTNREYNFGPFNYNTTTLYLTKDGIGIHLSPKENDLLYLLVTNSGKVVLHETICRWLWKDKDPEQTKGLIKKYVQSLRRKIGDKREDGKYRYIHSHPVVGYRFVIPSLDASP